MTTLNRRALLKGFGATAITAGTSARSRSGVRALAQDADHDDADCDVAIVGGGVSGAYCAWRLAQPDAAASAILRSSGVAGVPKVALFEASDRIGGRLWSFEPPGMPHLRAELGGMRIPTNQRLVVSLVERLGIETIPFPMGDTHNLRYLRGRRLTVADLGNPEVVPYDLPPELRGQTPDDIVIQTIERYIPHARSLRKSNGTRCAARAASKVSRSTISAFAISCSVISPTKPICSSETTRQSKTSRSTRAPSTSCSTGPPTSTRTSPSLHPCWGCRRSRAHSSVRPIRMALQFTGSIACAASFPSLTPARTNPGCVWSSRSFRMRPWCNSRPGTSFWPCHRAPSPSSRQTAYR